MKIFRFTATALLLTFVMSVCSILVSCSEDETEVEIETTTTAEAYSLAWTTSFSMAIEMSETDTTIVVDDYELSDDDIDEGVTIEMVTYYLQEQKIGERTSSPFGISYDLSAWSSGEYTLTIDENVAKDGVTFSASFDIPFYLPEPGALSIELGYGILQDTYGSALGTVKTYLSEDNEISGTITKVEYYWKDELVGESSDASSDFLVILYTGDSSNYVYIDQGEFKAVAYVYCSDVETAYVISYTLDI